ncbi:MAG: heavy metal transporter [Algicola sp.]|nr:heavy metal transporter [Algicola sp.]
MKHTYNVTGMTCNSCKAKVKEALQNTPHIDEVNVNLSSGDVTLTMSQHVALKTLQDALPDKYQISKKQEQNVFASTANLEEPKSDLQQLFPLFLIFGYIIVASVLINMKSWNWSDFMLDFMGLFYIVFSFFKLLDLKGFPESFKMYDPLAKAIPAYGWIYPFLETALGIMFLMRIQIPLALVITLIILGITTVGVTKTLLDKKSIQCACLGTALKLPMTKATFIENSIMIVMAIIMLVKMYA